MGKCYDSIFDPVSSKKRAAHRDRKWSLPKSTHGCSIYFPGPPRKVMELKSISKNIALGKTFGKQSYLILLGGG